MRQSDDMTTMFEMIIDKFASTWTLLLQYDDNNLERPKQLLPAHKNLSIEKAVQAIDILKNKLFKRGQAGDLFGRQRDQQLHGILGTINQTFDGQDLYPSAEEKAACLLYFIIKDHPFSDGNKRIGSLLFLLFLEINGILEQANISNNSMVSLALLIAESDPKQKDLLIRLVMNLLVHK